MVAKQIIIGDHIFNTQLSAKKYIRDLISKIGICNSVKNISQDYYEILLELCKRHPESEEKLRDIVDFRIIYNRFSKKYYELNIVKLHNIIIDISWKICISGRERSAQQDLNTAFRVCIIDQINEFRNKSNTTKCSLCQEKITKCHIDHVIHFQKIVDDFMKIYKFDIPTQYDIVNDGSNRICFTNRDKNIHDAFYNYHKNYAVLRVLCENCNLTRKKTARNLCETVENSA